MFCTECGTKVVVVEAPKNTKPMCEFCSKQLGLNRYLIGKTQSGKSLWKCPDCAKKMAHQSFFRLQMKLKNLKSSSIWVL